MLTMLGLRIFLLFFFSSRRRHTRLQGDWSSDVCSSDLQIVEGVRFYERAEIKDAMAYLAVISNPSDSGALERIINVPKRGLGSTSVARLQERPLALRGARGGGRGGPHGGREEGVPGGKGAVRGLAGRGEGGSPGGA